MPPTPLTIPEGLSAADQEAVRSAYIAGGGLASNIITSASLAPTPAITLPQPQPDTTPYNQIISGGNAFIKGSQLPTETQPQTTDLTKQLQELMGGQPSSTDLYNQAYNASGIDTAQQDALAKRRAVRSAQAKLGGIQSQLQAVADSAKQQNLQLEQSINQGSTGVGGAGALASGSFLNVRQQEINRQAAIASLPLQAQALAAAAEVAGLQGDAEYAQSTLGMAQEKLDTVFKLMSQDSSRKQELQMKMFDVIYNDASKKEQQQIDAMKTKSANNMSLYNNFVNDVRSSASAISGYQADVAKQMSEVVARLNPSSKTFQSDYAKAKTDFANLQGKVVMSPVARLDIAFKQLQLAKAQKELSLLGEPTPAETKAIKAALKEANASIPVMQDKIDAVDALKTNAGLSSRVGTNFLSRTPQGKGILGTLGKITAGIIKAPLTLGAGTFADISASITGAGQNFAGGVHKLVGGLTLQELIAAKARGATFGALSDSELRILANSATAISDWEIKDKDNKGIGIWNIDEASFKKELDTIKTLTQRAIIQTQGGVFSNEESSLLDELYGAETVSPANYY